MVSLKALISVGQLDVIQQNLAEVNDEHQQTVLEMSALRETIGKLESEKEISNQNLAMKDVDLKTKQVELNELRNEYFDVRSLKEQFENTTKDQAADLLNKTGNKGTVRVRTVDAEAVAGDDYVALDRIIHFK
jgi:predicted nuclease with TOPRIM domain